MGENYHLLPTNDLAPHTEEGTQCECNPEIEVMDNGNKVVIHNAYDGREWDELSNKRNY